MITLLGYYGFGNLGDELLLQACIEKLGKHNEIIVLSNNPEETRKNFGVEAVNRWRYREVIKALRKSEALYLGGGGLFQDVTSVKSCVWYWLIVRLAKFLGLKVFALGQSIGPLNSRLSRLLTANALRACERVEVRDENSYNVAKTLGCKNVLQTCDLVFSLAPGNPVKRASLYTLINLRPCENLDSFVDVIAPNVAKLTGEKIGVALSEEDEKILEALREKLTLSKIVRVKTLNEAKSLWEKASEAVGMRLHFGVLSVIFRVPVALMPYDIKVSELAKQFNIPCIAHEWQGPKIPDVIKFAHEQAQD